MVSYAFVAIWTHYRELPPGLAVQIYRFTQLRDLLDWTRNPAQRSHQKVDSERSYGDARVSCAHKFDGTEASCPWKQVHHYNDTGRDYEQRHVDIPRGQLENLVRDSLYAMFYQEQACAELGFAERLLPDCDILESVLA
jgi:hypothetical protein